MAIYLNGEPYSGKRGLGGQLSRIDLTRAEYDALTDYEVNVFYVVQETNNNTTVYLGKQNLKKATGSPIDPLDEITTYSYKYGNYSADKGKVGIKWTDPSNKVVNGETVATWHRTILVRKTNSYPATWCDGTKIISTTTKNLYQNSYFYDNTVDYNTTYYYGLFCQSEEGSWNSGAFFTITPQKLVLDAVNNLTVTGRKSARITWQDPVDISETTNALATNWAQTTIVRKIGSAPANINDGTTVIVEKTKNRYTSGNLSYIDRNLTPNTTYYYGAFAETEEGVISQGTTASFTTVPQYQTMTVKIDLTDSNPYTNCSYDDDATQMDFVRPIVAGGATSARTNYAVKDSDSALTSELWDEFFGHYPVILNNAGQEVVKLDPNDFTKTETGADATSYLNTSSYDVMIAFPIHGIKISKANDIVTISMTNDPEAQGYQYFAHTKGLAIKDKFYLGAYWGFNNNSLLYSQANKSATNNINLTNSRLYAESRGTNYQLMSFYQWLYIQVMYLLKYKNTNGQAALGSGWTTEGSSEVFAVSTGAMNVRGMDYGTTTSNNNANRIKLFGLEDPWGCYNCWVDGCYFNANGEILLNSFNQGLNNAGEDYYVNEGAFANPAGYWVSPIGTSNTGFIPSTEEAGSSTTYFADQASLSNETCLCVGGPSNGDTNCGPFYLKAQDPDTANWTNAARLCYISTTNI